MHLIKKVTSDMYWVGGNDRRLALFENVFPVPRGVSYNAYVVLDEKTVLMDTVDRSVGAQFFENLAAALDGRSLDYVVVNHMEPDHCATLDELILRYPGVQVVCNGKTQQMIRQFFDFDIDSRSIIVKEGDTLTTGRHTFAFVMAPMVHWPEAMVTYDTLDKVLYSADAFGTFGAINGNLFADEVDFETEWLPDARRYYTNIVGKYGVQVQTLLKKAAGLDIAMICPLHGPVWRKDIPWYVEKYLKWSTYTPEEDSVMIAYASVYGHTETTAALLASKLADRGVRNIAMYDVSVTHPSVIVAEAFRCSHLVFASTTYNAGIFCNMETALLDIKAHNLQNRTVAIIENGSWAPMSGDLMEELIRSMKNMTVLDGRITLNSAMKPSQEAQLDALADAIVDSMPKKEMVISEAKIQQNAMFDLSYGLYVLTAKDGEKDNGCVINAVLQVTDTPKQVVVTVNKENYTHDMIRKTGLFNICVLSQDAPFKVFEHFGFSSGKEVDKFAQCTGDDRSDNGLRFLPKYCNSYISGRVVQMVDCGTHTMFVAEVTEAVQLSQVPSMTYQFYFDHVKPKPQPLPEDQKGFVCKICGYVYEGDTLPADFICPLCKHGAEDFEPLP